MKRMLLALGLLASPVYAIPIVQTVKVSDGKTAYCKTSVDAYRNKLGVYKAQAIRAKVVSGIIQFDIAIQFLHCVKTDNEYTFIFKKPYEEYSYETYSNQGVVVTKAKEVRLRAYKDGVYQILASQILPNQVSLVQSISVALEDVLNPRSPNKGELDFWIDKKVVYFIEAQGVEFKDLINFGSYRIRFQLIQSDNGIQVKLL